MKHSRSWPLAALLVTAAMAALPVPASASSVEVKLQLPQRARLNLQGRNSIAVAPFLVVTQEAEGADRLQGRDIDVRKEFERYLLKILRRETELKIIEPGPVDYPVYDFTQLAKQQDFWRALGERTQADLILAGGLDFDIQDRSGYQMQEYVSPFNGRTYYRQVLVEQTGFEYDILMQVYDGHTGDLLYQDNFKDFQSFEGEGTDPLAGMFENLLSLEDRILNVFTQKEVEATRLLFTQ
ncbi:MAG: hypothetical protein ABUT39_05440 [Acidobacteriota bacterium]